MHFLYRDLPEPLRGELAAAAVGRNHLMRLSARAVDTAAQGGPEASRQMLRSALAFLQGAWEHDLLNKEAAQGLLDFEGKTAAFGLRLHACVRSLAESVVSAWHGDTGEEYEEFMSTGDEDGLVALLEDAARRHPSSGLVARQAWYAAFHHDLWEWYLGFVDGPGSLEDPRLHSITKAVALAQEGRAEEGASLVDSIDDLSAMPTTMLLKAHMLRLAEDDGLKAALTEIVRNAPWQTNALLALHDVVSARDGGVCPPDGSVAILIYSYNKAQLLDETLESVFASRLHGARVIVLNNGSSDETSSVLDRWAEGKGAEEFLPVQLPVNIGAPAARNWLKAMPEVHACDWTVYLDDDVVLPEDWLERLAFSAREYPCGGAWGCRVMHVKPTAMVQSADVHLLPTSKEGSAFDFSEAHLNALDIGQFNSLRPACHVIGCCHLFKTSRLIESGDFDIRFSPSQLDDVDHDIALCMQGRFPVMNGHLAVRHVMATGVNVGKTRAQLAGAESNAAKLHSKYTPEQMQALHAAWSEALVKDLEEKWAALHEMGALLP